MFRRNLLCSHSVNTQIYEVPMADPKAWSSGYIEGFSQYMMAWSPMLLAQPSLLKVILANAVDQPLHAPEESLTDVARQIHTYWVGRRLNGIGIDGVLPQLTSLLDAHPVPPDLRLH
jgi:hypothetical protein